MFRRCKHDAVRCIHGDEIISTTRAWRRPTWARARCLRCGKALYDQPLPDPCWFTDEPHSDPSTSPGRGRDA